MNIDNAPVGRKENDIERYVGVLHPERLALAAAVDSSGSAIRERTSSPAMLMACPCDVDIEHVTGVAASTVVLSKVSSKVPAKLYSPKDEGDSRNPMHAMPRTGSIFFTPDALGGVEKNVSSVKLMSRHHSFQQRREPL